MGLDTIGSTFFRNSSTIGLDLETTSYYDSLPDPFRDRILLVGLSNGTEHLVVEPGDWLNLLWGWIDNPEHLLIGHNLKFDLKFLWEAGLHVRRPNVWDTMIVERILEAGKFSRCNLGATAWRRAFVKLEKEIGKTFRKHLGDFTERQLNYAKADVKYLHLIKQAQESEVTSWGIEELIQLENKLVPILTEAEYRGICFDSNLWKEVAKEELQKASQAEGNFMQSLGIQPEFGLLGDPQYPINLNSPQQVMAALQSEGYLSLENTSKQTLENYIKNNPGSSALRHLLTYREHQKRASFNYSQYINPKTGQIHTNYNQCGAQTGRLSSSQPNMQNVVADSRWRKLFAVEEDYLLIGADYAQQEVRILAEMSDDKNLIEVCKSEDIHLENARRIYNDPTITKDDKRRRLAKGVTFAMAYGASAETVARSAGVPLKDGKRVLNYIKTHFPDTEKWAQRQISKVRYDGYVETISGRRCWFPNTSDDMEYRWANQARNMPVQGSGADMVKLAMVYVDMAFRERDLDANIVLTVHDEILCQANESCVEEAEHIIRYKMIEAANYFLKKVPCPVDTVVGKTWIKI